jgi:cell division septal protein FtsQ
MGVLRLLGGLLGIAALLTLLVVAIWATMWLVLLTVRHLPMVGRRHRHDRWSAMQREGNRAPRSRQMLER